MTRSTRTDLARFAPPKALAGIADADQDKALEGASDFADGYLGARYTLPLTTWGDDLIRAECAVALWDLLGARNYNPQPQLPDSYRTRYLDAIKWLEAVRDSHVVPSGVTDSSPAGQNHHGMAGPQIYTEPKRGW